MSEISKRFSELRLPLNPQAAVVSHVARLREPVDTDWAALLERRDIQPTQLEAGR